MYVLVDVPRTIADAALAIADALQTLGYGKIYHMREVQKHGHIDKWTTLLDAKFGPEQRALTRSDFDEVLSDFDVITNQPTVEVIAIADTLQGLADFPASIFAKELIDAYPEAKVILTVRDDDAWIASMKSTLIFAHTAPDVDKNRPMYPIAERYHRYCWHDDYDRYGREYAGSFRETVRKAAPNRLEYSVKEGWEPLCSFLELDVPETAFPRSDEVAQYRWKGHGERKSQEI